MEWNNIGKIVLYDLNGTKLAQCDSINTIAVDRKFDDKFLSPYQRTFDSFELIVNFNHITQYKPRQSKRYKKNRQGFR